MNKNIGAIILIGAVILGAFIVCLSNRQKNITLLKICLFDMAQKEKANLLNFSDEAQKKVKLLEDCLSDADWFFRTRWNSACETQKLAKDCGLSPSSLVNTLEDYRRELKNDCYQKYPQK